MLTIKYIGQCGFYIYTDTKAIAIDPVLNDLVDEDGKSIRKYPPVMEYKELKVDYIFCTHDHIDHMAKETLVSVAKLYEEVKYVVPDGCKHMLIEWGIKEENIVGVAAGEKIKLKDIDGCVKGISTAHPVHQKDEHGLDRNLAYSIEIDGKKLVHLGDTYMTEQLRNDLKELGKIDSIMLPINGRDEIREAQGIIGNLNCEEAAELAAYLRPNLSIPTHFDMVVGNTADPAVFGKCLHAIIPESKCWIPTLMEEYNLI